jgi:hypothetical protein
VHRKKFGESLLAKAKAACKGLKRGFHVLKL